MLCGWLVGVIKEVFDNMCNCVQDYQCWMDAKSIFLFIGDLVENSVTELYVGGGVCSGVIICE